jgi:type I restriction enzyme R subunit
MALKEAKARVKINQLLAEAQWRFFDSAQGQPNVILEPNVKITQTKIDALGENFEHLANGFVDFLLLDDHGFPLAVLEAKAEDKSPLVGKEQARTYAKSQNCRFVLLSNGNLHYFWDLHYGNPHLISAFPTPDSLQNYTQFEPDPKNLAGETVASDFIARTQLANYDSVAGWKIEAERPGFIEKNRLRFLRPYQVQAIQALQRAVAQGKDRFLFEMATGTGKTLTSAAVIKLFLRTGNARRVLFLVDRLELEDQAQKAFILLLKNDYTSVIYKERREDWRKAEIVVTTVQSLMFHDRYKALFSPTDFDLVISDEAHRSISGDARAVFEYFVGYKLGLTATPKDYLKKITADKPTTRDPREMERRHLLDTYTTFGCGSGEPTYRYSLLDGVRDGYLINPLVVDARTEITTQLLSDEGYAVVTATVTEDGATEENFVLQDFEKTFFSEPTNQVFCETFLLHALRDPISGEIGKSLVFAVSQAHAAKLTQMLNEVADRMFPGRYHSDFAVQVTSQITDAQLYTTQFTNNNLLGSANFLPGYKTSTARVCVTVGMMTTGYDCPDLLNLALMRPVFSPSEFVQIKGRGTRRHRFTDELFDDALKPQITEPNKTRYKLFDFFGNYEYFEETFQYDEILKLPPLGQKTRQDPGEKPNFTAYENAAPDPVEMVREYGIGEQGMKIDRMLFQKFTETVTGDTTVQSLVDDDRWEQAAAYVMTHLLGKPTEFFTLEGLRKAAHVDRRVSMSEILERAFGRIERFKSKDELLEDEFRKFILTHQVEEVERLAAIRYYFKAYATNPSLREILDSRQLTKLNTNAALTTADYKAVPEPWRSQIPEYIKDYVLRDQFS